MSDAVEVNAGSQGEITEQNIFVHRLMYAKCNFGSMSHPLNVAEVAAVMESYLDRKSSLF